LLKMEKSWEFVPEMSMDEIVVEAFRSPVRITDFGAPLLPTETLPQVKEVGLTVTGGLANAVSGTKTNAALNERHRSRTARLKGPMRPLLKKVREGKYEVVQDIGGRPEWNCIQHLQIIPQAYVRTSVRNPRGEGLLRT
jgi:hypothetical protein